MTDDLERALLARGAVLEHFHGVRLPAHFGDVGREWRAASGGAGVYVAGFRSAIAATGEDRVTFLQGMLSNDVKALAAGQGTYAAFLTQQGKLVSDLRVYAEPDRLLLDVLAWRRATLQEGLEKFIVADDVELTAPDGEEFLLGVEGPMARAATSEALGIDALPEAPYAHIRTEFEGAPLLVIAVSEIERSGILLCGPPRIAPALFAACVEAGAQPIGMQALDTLRVESGVPWAGVDMDDTTLIMETGRTAALSFTKGCYLGQEVVERIAARGHVNRQLTGVILDGDAIPAAGARLLADGREVGYVTSAVRSQALERPIALAIVQSKHSSPGERVVVQTDADAVGATVSALPFAADTEE
jgi:folate-binding protein YgfZ